MSDQSLMASKPDAFKARMAAAQADGRPELAHQSLGRPLSGTEKQLTQMLMEIYAAGTIGEADLAAALTQRGTVRPSTDKVDWTADNVALELKTLNEDLDAAYQQNGFGA